MGKLKKIKKTQENSRWENSRKLKKTQENSRKLKMEKLKLLFFF